jgi:acetolactate synthase-1/2/3 large subunit
MNMDADEGHEAILQAIAANGSDCIFFCGGTDNFLFMESVAKARALGRPAPKLITCLHESVALSAAHGHFMVSGKPQVVVVHVDLGTQNAGGAIHNAWVGNAGIIFMAGRTPWTTQGELRGSRSSFIHFIQETYDQAEIVRQYTKWDYELKTTENVGLIVQRAYQMAASEPYGPVYLTLPREVLMAPMKGCTIYEPAHYAPAVSPQGDTQALQEAAELLIEAENPVILVKRMGRHPEAVSALVELAGKMAIPVVDTSAYLNFPKGNPLYVSSYAAGSYVQSADVILQIDHNVPYTPVEYAPPANCRIISMDIDPMRSAQPLWGFPVDIPITCSSAKAIPLLSRIADGLIKESNRRRFRERWQQMEAKYQAAQKERAATITKVGEQTPISTDWLGHCIDEVVDQNTIVIAGLARGISPAPQAQPGSYFGLPGSSLGWAVPAALGAKLAAPDKTVIAACGDGCFVFANPVAVLWTARQYNLPFLVVIVNNKEYKAVSDQIRNFYPDGYVMRGGDFNGARIDPSLRYALVAEACGAYGEEVTDPGQVKSALKRGLEAVQGGKAAVLDVHVVASDSDVRGS